MIKLLLYIQAVLMFMFPAFSSAVDVGGIAPDFRGTSTKGKIGLSDYLGKKHVVLALYFRAFTPV